MLRLFVKVFSIFLAAMFLSVCLDAIYRHTYQLKYKWPENVLPKPAIPEKFQIVKLGNSHSEDGLIFERYKLRSLSLASVAQSFEYDLAMLKMYANQIENGAIIIINVSPMSFIQKKPGKAESLQYQYYDGRLSPLVIPHLQVGDYLQSQIIPFTRTGYVWRETHAKLLKEGAMDAYASNWPTPTPTLIPTVTPTGSASAAPSPMPTAPKSAEEELATAPYWPQDRLQNSVKFMINKWLHTGDFGTQYVDENRKDLEELIRYSERKKWKSVIISIPISQLFMDELGPSFMKAYVDEPLKNALLVGGEFIDFSSYRNFRENAYLFSNADHLNYYGANIFSHLLLERLNEKGYLPNEANGY